MQETGLGGGGSAEKRNHKEQALCASSQGARSCKRTSEHMSLTLTACSGYHLHFEFITDNSQESTSRQDMIGVRRMRDKRTCLWGPLLCPRSPSMCLKVAGVAPGILCRLHQLDSVCSVDDSQGDLLGWPELTEATASPAAAALSLTELQTLVARRALLQDANSSGRNAASRSETSSFPGPCHAPASCSAHCPFRARSAWTEVPPVRQALLGPLSPGRVSVPAVGLPPTSSPVCPQPRQRPHPPQCPPGPLRLPGAAHQHSAPLLLVPALTEASPRAPALHPLTSPLSSGKAGFPGSCPGVGLESPLLSLTHVLHFYLKIQS
nr:uncharacterized protein LOC105883748 isoform X2 [Microcebus murinus]XP_020143356.1 uncharacterized protein LOC105883748 isoform X2 [Microcebus murinus]XP_020143357.1 uncharacterized protein LOC105883748 isoform X2 [Microcebus murinus]XP_020143358.1 uncharacterized protein LOC105883748 isoform X2 [Microcebus murinus]